MDLALQVDRPNAITVESTKEEKDHFAKWERSNRLCLLAMRRSISEHLLSGLPEDMSAKELLAEVSKRYFVSDKAESSVLLKRLTSMSYDNEGGVRDYILQMVHIQSKLKALEIPLPDKFIVHQALDSLPHNFSQIKTAYISQNESWTVNDLISKCMAEEEKLKREKVESALLVSTTKSGFRNDKGKSKGYHPSASKDKKGFKRHGNDQSEGGSKLTNKKNVKCFFCQKKGHYKKDCFKLKAQQKKQNQAEGAQERKETKRDRVETQSRE